jgi:hypothetical protein
MGRFLRTCAYCSVADPDSDGEADRRDEAGELPSVMEGLRHHRVREHRQHGTARECEHDRDRTR